MSATDRDPIDWDEIKARLHREIWEFAGRNLKSAVPGISDEIPGWAEYNWYRSRPPEERNPPGLTAADFAEAYRGDPPFSRRLAPDGAEGN